MPMQEISTGPACIRQLLSGNSTGRFLPFSRNVAHAYLYVLLASLGGARKQVEYRGKEAALPAVQSELNDPDLVLPSVLPFKFKGAQGGRETKGSAREKHWKHLKQTLQGENYHQYPPNVNIEALPLRTRQKSIVIYRGLRRCTEIPGQNHAALMLRCSTNIGFFQSNRFKTTLLLETQCS